MGILDRLRKGLSKDEEFLAEKKARKIQRLLDEREKSSNERVLEKLMEEKRQEAIKKKLAAINKAETHNQYTGKYHPGEFIFKGNNTVMQNTMPILKSNKKMLSGKSMFFK